MGGDPQAMGAARSHRAPPAGHSRSAPVSWVLATASWITTVDHKRIGILYGVSAFAFFLLGGLEALLIRLQLAAPDAHVVSAETYNALFTMHGTTMVFLAIMPLNAAFFNYMVPLLIGARDVAFPRLNALSYWIFLFGGLFLNASYLVGTPPDVGWFGYANLTSKQFSPSHSVDFWLLSLQLLGVSSMIAAINFIVTILNMRPPAPVRRAGRRLFGRPDRLLRLRRVEPPHVRRGHGAGRGRRVLDRDHAHRDPDGREDLQLARDALGRIDPRDDCVPLRGRPRRALHDRRALGHHARLAARGPPADRQLLRRRAPALRAHRRQPLRPLRRRLLLVAEDHRTAPRRAARQAPVLGPLRGLQHDLLPPALPGRDRDASPHLHVRGGDRLDPLERRLHRRRLRDRGGRPPLHGQRVVEPACGRPCAPRPVGRAHARVAHLGAHPAARLRHGPSGPRERHVLEREVWSARGPPCPHPRPHPPPGSVPLAGGGRARHGGPGGRRAHPSHDRADGRPRHHRPHLPPGTRAPPDPRAPAPDGRPPPRPSGGRAVGGLRG